MKNTIINNNHPFSKKLATVLLASALSFTAGSLFAQTPPNPGTPPPPPPSPKELFNKINPFKKNKTAPQPPVAEKAKKEDAVAPPAPGQAPPPPPNPLNLFKKKKTAKP